MPISLPLLDNLTHLANAYAESSPVHNQMAAVRQEIGSIMNKYCQKNLDENNVSVFGQGSHPFLSFPLISSRTLYIHHILFLPFLDL
jgi:hypothetical protein